MSIRTRLVWLVVALTAPTLAFALYMTYSVYRSQSAQVAQSMQGTTRALALAVDRELAKYDAIVSTVAANPSLVQGDLRTLHSRLQQTVQPLDAGVTVFDPYGIPLLSSKHPYGAPMPMPPSLPTLVAPRGTHQLDVSSLFRNPHDNRYAIAIHRPVIRDGRTVYYLTMDFPVAGLGAILAEQELPERWLGVVLDSQHNIVARSRDAHAHVGKRASEHFRHQLEAMPPRSGLVESVTRDGEQVTTFYSRIDSTHWMVLIAIPKAELLASILAPILTAVFGIALVLLAIAMAILVGRTITRPLALLDLAAAAMGRGETIEAVETGMDETDRTARALAQASLAINRSNQVMAERVAEAVSQAERSHQAMLQGQKLEALGRLTGGIAHDFNNLLQSMTVGLQLADMLCVQPRAKRAIEACQRSVERGTQLTRKLMTFSRGRTSELKRVDLRTLILGMRELLHGALPTRVDLSLDLPEGDWPILVDPLQCELAILNLAINARDAMPDGGSLSINLSRRMLQAQDEHGLASGPYIQLDIIDSGCGMSEEVKTRAFEPFYTTKGVNEGTGLGLAQVYGFAHHSNGSVSIDSEVGQGTRVSLLLPYASETNTGPQPTPQPTKLLTGTARILLVDDDGEVRDVVASMLEELGYAVEIAKDAQTALARLAAADQPRVDLLFSDIVMPGDLDGVGLAEEVRARYPELRVVLATGYTERMPSEQGTRILTKPF